jgi:hypothetical protein
MTTFIAIAGSPKAGITVLKKDGSISRLEVAGMASLDWNAAVNAKKEKDLTGYAALTTAGGTTITTLAVKDSIEYITSFKSKAEWKKIDPPLPDTLQISNAAGDQAGGFMVLDGEGKPHHVDAESRAWSAFTPPLPFKAQHATQIAGDGTNGFLLLSTDEMSNVARSNADCTGWTLLKPAAPIKIDLLTGDFKNGFVVYGEGQLYSLKADKDAATWSALGTPDFDFVALAGNATDGVAALVSANTTRPEADLVVYSTGPGKDPWVLTLVAEKEAVSAA